MPAEEFKNRDLKGSRFTHVDLSEAHFHGLLMRNVRITGAWIQDLVIEAEIDGTLTVNGVDVAPHVNEELNRRYPGRDTIFATLTSGAGGFQDAWALIERVWLETVERARRLPEEKLHERVDGEWSFIETLRHLVFATDSWVNRALLGDPSPYHTLDLPFSEMGEIEGVPNDPDARPSLDEVLALRADRMGTVRSVIGALTDHKLEETTEPVPQTGYPASEAYLVRRCIGAVVIEEWEHHLFANRDLAVLESR